MSQLRPDVAKSQLQSHMVRTHYEQLLLVFEQHLSRDAPRRRIQRKTRADDQQPRVCHVVKVGHVQQLLYVAS